MTTAELIRDLRRLDPSGKGRVIVPVKSYTKIYPHAYLEPFSVATAPAFGVDNNGTDVRLYVSFPEGFSVHKRKGVSA